METIEKAMVNVLKNDIKKLVEEQKSLKNFRMIQAAHAAIEFQHEHPEIAKEWNTNSKYLVFLSVEKLLTSKEV